MNITPDASRRLTAVLAALAVAGCAASHGGPSTAATSAPPSGPFYGLETATGGGAAGSATQHSGDGTMCAMHREMQAAPNEAARRAIAERQMQGMSPEQRDQRMQMMRQHCK
ncbi:hypothetical protein [Massilia sp. UBA6681]|uniref:hypothetical protein n=1 Tax=Massilia sp. UBA6681 TaxID=1946839 RepID=UPI0025BE246C|nr:hypothetical protein [Massilia sp. UBA6681]